MTSIDTAARPIIAHGFRLQWEPVQNAHVLLYPEGMVKLNVSAGEILKRCDGERTLVQIVRELEQAFEARDLTNEVSTFVTTAVERNWLELRT